MADSDTDPFRSLLARAGGVEGHDETTTDPADPFGPLIKKAGGLGAPEEGSALGAAGRGFMSALMPGAATIAGGAAGAEIGAAIGLIGGPFAEFTVPAFGFLGAMAGGWYAGKKAGEAQDYAVKAMPDSWQEAIGQSDRQKRLDELQHPVASFVGGTLPYMLTLRPGRMANLPANATAWDRVMAGPVTGRLFSGAVMGGFEVGQEAYNGEFDWRKAAISTGFGMIFNRPWFAGQPLHALGTAVGRGLTSPIHLGAAYAEMTGARWPGHFAEGDLPYELMVGDLRGSALYGGRYLGEENAAERRNYPWYDEEGNLRRDWPSGPAPVETAEQRNPGLAQYLRDVFAGRTVTLAEANANGVLGPGVTDETYFGTQLRDPRAEAIADEQRRQELAVLYGPQGYGGSIHDLVRDRDPELFERYDALTRWRDTLQRWQRESLPESGEARLAELDRRAAELQVERDRPMWMPERRRIDAMLADIEQERQGILQAKANRLIGEGTPSEQQLAARIRSVEEQIAAEEPRVRSAYRAAEEELGRRPQVERPEVPVEVQPPAGAVPTRGALPSTEEGFWGKPGVWTRNGRSQEADIRSLTSDERGELMILVKDRNGQPAIKRVPASEVVSTPGAPQGNMAQGQFIARDVARRAMASGRMTQEQADAYGQIYAERMVTRAAWRQESPLELYRAEGAGIARSQGKALFPPGAPPPPSEPPPSGGAPSIGPGAAPTAVAPAAPVSALPEKYRGWKAGDTVSVGGFVNDARVEEVLPTGFVLERPTTGQRWEFTPPKGKEPPDKDLSWFNYLRDLPKRSVTEEEAPVLETPPAAPRPLEEELAEFEQLRGSTAPAVPTAEPPANFEPTPEELGWARRMVRGWQAEKPIAGQSLVDFVRRNGGIDAASPQAGDLRSQDLGRVRGLLQDRQAATTGGAKQTGRDVTDMAQMARDAGFDLGPDTGVGGGVNADRFMEMLLEDASGRRKHYPDMDALDIKASADLNQQLDQYLNEIGLNPKGMDARTVAWILRQEPDVARTIMLLRQGMSGEALSLEVANRLDAQRAEAEKDWARSGAEFAPAPGTELEAYYADIERTAGEGREGGPAAETGGPEAARPAEGGEPPSPGSAGPAPAEEAPRVGPEEPLRTEQTEQGEQTLIPGVEPITEATRQATELGSEGGLFATPRQREAAEETRATAEKEETERRLREAARLEDERNQTDLFGKAKEEYEQRVRDVKRGSYDPVRRIIRLFRDADASTVLHEFAHDFLEQLKRDAVHPQAPEQLRNDMQTVLRWFGIEKIEDITDAHHEQFANGFEQYYREGTAPSRRLETVFLKFREWMTRIYKTADELGVPINDEIRGVFGRMLSSGEERTVIAPDRERQPTLADVQEQDAREVEPVQAAATGDRMKAEREAVTAPTVEVQNEVQPIVEEVRREREATAVGGGEAAAGPEGGGTAGTGGGEPGAEPGGGGAPAGTAANGAGGGEGPPEGPRVSTQPAGRARSSDDSPLSPRPIQRFADEQSPAVDKAGNIRLENITNDDELRGAARAMSAVSGEFIGDRRQPAGDAEIRRLAEDMGMEGAERLVRDWVRGKAYNAEEVLGLRLLFQKTLGDFMGILRQASAPTASDQTILDMAAMAAQLRNIQRVVSGATAEWGRAGRAFRSIAEGSGGIPEAVQELEGKTLFQMRTIARLGAKMETTQATGSFLEKMGKLSFTKMIFEYWVNGLISGTATHTTYVVGNALLSTYAATFETAAAAAIGAAREAAGREGERVRFGEVGAGLKGMAQGMVPAVHSFLEATRTGVAIHLPGDDRVRVMPFITGTGLVKAPELNQAATVRDIQASMYGVVEGIKNGFKVGADVADAVKSGTIGPYGLEPSPLGEIPNVRVGQMMLPVGEVARLPSRMVGAIHSAFLTGNFFTDLAAQAYRRATEEALARPGMSQEQFNSRIAYWQQSPTVEMLSRANGTAYDRTLMGSGSKFTNMLSRLVNTEFFGGPWLKFIDPFVHISSNIIEESLLKRTPLGLVGSARIGTKESGKFGLYLTKDTELSRDLRGDNGNVAQDKAIARMMVGSAFGVLIGGLASQGFVTGSGPQDPRQRAEWELLGYQPHSVRVGDMWIDMHRLGVLGMMLSTGADLYDVANHASKGEMAAAGNAFGMGVVHNVLDESFMRGPQELIRAIENHNGYQDVWLRQMAASFMPASVLMSQMARAVDPYSREARTMIDTLKLKTPWMSQELLPRIDIWGEPVPNREVLFGASGVLALYTRRMNNDPVNHAMVELAIGPSPVERKIRGIELTPEQHYLYAQMAGRMAKQRLDAIVTSPDWQMIPPEQRFALIQTQLRQSRETAAGYIISQDPTIAVRASQLKTQRAEEGARRGAEALR